MSHEAGTINIPITSVKPLFRNDKTKTIVFETPIESLMTHTDPDTLDGIIAQAKLDYAVGDYESFDNVEDLIKDLRSWAFVMRINRSTRFKRSLNKIPSDIQVDFVSKIRIFSQDPFHIT